MGHSPRVNHGGVLLLCVIGLSLIVLFQVVEDGGMNVIAVDDATSLDHVTKELLPGSSLENGKEDEDLFEKASFETTLLGFVSVVMGDDVHSNQEPVVLTYATFGYRTTLLNWLVSLQKVQVKHVAIVCLDEDLKSFLSKREIPCFFLDSQALVGDEDQSTMKRGRGGKNSAKVKSISRLWILRLTHLTELLKAGISVILSDSDAIWIDNPIANGLMSERTGDVVLSRGKFPFELAEQWGATACMGLAYFRSTQKVIDLVSYAQKEGVTANDDQVGVNRALFQSYGLDPLKVFGRKAELYGSNEEIAPAQDDLPRFVLISHTHVPRFCSYLSRNDWKQVQVAHCHARDGVVAKTYKNWGDAKSRNTIMIKYNLWCAGIEDSPEEPRKFKSWLKDKVDSCSFGL